MVSEFQTWNGNYDSLSLIGFLEDMQRELRGQRATFVSDGLPAHKSRIMTDLSAPSAGVAAGGTLAGLRDRVKAGGEPYGQTIKGQELAKRWLRTWTPRFHAGMGGLCRTHLVIPPSNVPVSLFGSVVTVLSEI